jgi:ABC-type sugar transport system substrate-binding protein
MKKTVAIVSAVLVLLSVMGCDGSSKSGSGSSRTDRAITSTEAKPFKYGFISWGTADEHGRTLNAACAWAITAAGGQILQDGSAITAETTIAAVENLIQAGCNMIAFCTYAGEASVPRISRLCQENQVYWTMWDTTIASSDVQNLIASDPYFVGTTNENQYDAGYKTMKTLLEKGARNIIMVKYGVNIPTCDDRTAGGYAAVAEVPGAKVLYEIVTPEDYRKAAQDALVAYPQTDCFFLAGSGSQSAAMAAACQDRGLSNYYIGAFDYFDGMGQMLQEGSLQVINGGHMVTSTFSALMAINSYYGTPLSADKYQITIPYLTLSSYEDYEAYIEFASRGAAYNADEMKQFIKINNSSLTLNSFQDMVSKWSIADIRSRKGL